MACLENEVARIAEATLADQQFVTPIDILIGLGWLTPANVDRWQRGVIASLDLCVQVDDATASAAVDALRIWAQDRGLPSWDTDYHDQFTADGDPAAERAFRVRWATAEQPAPELPRQHGRQLTVESPVTAWECASCNSTGDPLIKMRSGVLCLDCADLGHLVFLPPGDAALTRRARKASRLSVVVVRWNSRRNRYERHGILAENDAIELAARQCLEDADARAPRNNQVRDDFAAAIREQFPGCSPARANAIAYHAALRRDRSRDPDAVRLAVAASVQHVDTDYDGLLISGVGPADARQRVRDRVDAILGAWRDGATTLDT